MKDRESIATAGRLADGPGAGWWPIAPVVTIFLLLAAGCSSKPTYPRQVITVLPPAPEGPSAGQYPAPGPQSYPGAAPEHPGQVPPQIPGAVYPRLPPTASQVPGETRPQVPGEVSPPGPGAPSVAGQSHYNQGVLLFRQGNV
ncbi:MAG TPA: hypothetical protein VGH29_08535, partial [Candidatus Binataceae bacterium]